MTKKLAGIVEKGKALIKAKKKPDVMNFISERSANLRAAGAAAAGAAVGGGVGYKIGKHKAKGGEEKKASVNIYLEKIAGTIGEVGKALIRNKLAPAMTNMSKGTASGLENIARVSAGSKVAPRIHSAPEYAQHASRMAGLGNKLLPGMRGSEANKLFAVATRAKKMGVI